MNKFTDNNTRKFYRNSTEAFPNTCDYACSVEVFSSQVKGYNFLRNTLVGILIFSAVYSLVVVFKGVQL